MYSFIVIDEFKLKLTFQTSTSVPVTHARIKGRVMTLSISTIVLVWRDTADINVRQVTNLAVFEILTRGFISLLYINSDDSVRFTDIDECSPLPCQHNGTCTDAINMYTCACPLGFTGLNCESGKI